MHSQTQPPVCSRTATAAPGNGSAGGERSLLIAPVARLRQRRWEEDQLIPAWHGWWWTLLIVSMLVVVTGQLGATNWHTDLTVTGLDGTVYRVPETFATHDHPFHIAKQRATLDALLGDGWLLYYLWQCEIFDEHGGELYPLPL